MKNTDKKKYFAFISYSHKDSEMAKWLQHEFEYYELPAKLFEERKNLRKEDLPESFRPIFRDEDELSGGELKPQISEALADSEYLIVVCSPNSAQSVYVDSEIKEFISLSQKNKKRIFPFIVDGKPHQDDDNKEKECFPKTLLGLSEDKTDPVELIAGDIHATGRDHAFVKILAGTLYEKDIRFADLWNRYAIEKAEQERKEREDKEKLQIAQSRFVAEKALDVIKEDSYLARRLAIAVLPKNTENPDRPYTPEAEFALRKSTKYRSAVFRGHNAFIMSVCFSPDKDNRYILSASLDKTVRLWDTQSGSDLVLPGGGFESFNYAVFSPNGNYIAAASCDSCIHIWKTNNGKPEYFRPLIGHSGIVRSVMFNNDGSLLVSASDDNTVRIWDFVTGKEKKSPLKHLDRVNHAVFSPDGRMVASSSKDNTIRVWDVESGVEKYPPTIGIMSYSVNFNQKGTKIVVGASYKREVVVLDAKTGNVIKKIPTSHSDYVKYSQFIFDDRMIITTSGDEDCSIRIWDYDSEELVKSLEGHIKASGPVALSTHGDRLVTASWDKTIRVWDLMVDEECDKEINSIEDCGNRIQRIAMSPNAKLAVFTSIDGTANLWDLETRKMINKLTGHRNAIKSVAFNKDSNILATGSNRMIIIWNALNGERIKAIPVSASVGSIAFNPQDNKELAWGAGGDEKFVHIFNIERAIEINTFKGHEGYIYSIAYSPDGKLIASGSNDKTMRVWDIIGGKQIGDVKKHIGTVYSVSFSEDGRYIISGSGDNDNTIRIWEMDNEREIKEQNSLNGHTNNVHFVSFCNMDNRMRVISASSDKTIRIWDAESGKEIRVFRGHTNRVLFACYDIDNRCIISACADGTVRFWTHPSLQELIKQTDERFKDNPLTFEEQKTYYLE